MVDRAFSELFNDFIEENRKKCPDLLMPRVRHISKDPPFPNGSYEVGYDRVNLKVFLNCMYPHSDLYANSYTSGSILEDLKNAFLDFTFYDTHYFSQTYGSLMTIPFLEMKYYQDEIDIRGRNPLNGGIGEPVLVVQYNSGKVIYNGYHRASINMLVGKNEIQAYVLKV